MTVREAARELDLSLWMIWQLCVAGVIPSWRAEGRILIRREDVEDYATSFGARVAA